MIANTAQMTFFQKVNRFIQKSPARMAVILAVLLYIITVLKTPSSLNMSAITSIVMLTILLSIASAGQTVVLISGGLDFTVGSVMSTAAILTTGIMNSQNGRFFPTFFACVAVGAAVGLLNGICSVKIGLPAMIVTMAISNVVSRLQYVITEGSPVGYASPSFIKSVTGKLFGFIPSIVLYAAIVFPLVFYVLNRSRFGRQVYLVGNNPTAARLNGINVNRTKILAYVFSGILAAFAGMLGVGYMQSARCQIFDEYAFNSLVAVIVGGTAFTGGVGSYTGSIAGSLLMVVLNNALTSFNLPQPTRNIMLGVIMVLLLVLYNREKSVRQ